MQGYPGRVAGVQQLDGRHPSEFTGFVRLLARSNLLVSAEGASSRASITTVSFLVESQNLLVEPNIKKNIPKLILYYFLSKQRLDAE